MSPRGSKTAKRSSCLRTRTGPLTRSAVATMACCSSIRMPSSTASSRLGHGAGLVGLGGLRPAAAGEAAVDPEIVTCHALRAEAGLEALTDPGARQPARLVHRLHGAAHVVDQEPR